MSEEIDHDNENRDGWVDRMLKDESLPKRDSLIYMTLQYIAMAEIVHPRIHNRIYAILKNCDTRYEYKPYEDFCEMVAEIESKKEQE